jgi:dTDP-4-dehydrorhamnose 3,5-epimerase
MIERVETAVPGFLELRPPVREDGRGRFVKVFHEGDFARLGLATAWAEEYYSVSTHRVLRGLHFQLPPHDCAKLVYCVSGSVMDVGVDLRVGSPTYGRHATLDLSAARGNMAYLEAGLAHGFYVREGPATLVYKVTAVYAPDADTGILWSSAGIAWPDPGPVVSERDRGFAPLARFDSPFRFA